VISLGISLPLRRFLEARSRFAGHDETVTAATRRLFPARSYKLRNWSESRVDRKYESPITRASNKRERVSVTYIQQRMQLRARLNSVCFEDNDRPYRWPGIERSREKNSTPDRSATESRRALLRERAYSSSAEKKRPILVATRSTCAFTPFLQIAWGMIMKPRG